MSPERLIKATAALKFTVRKSPTLSLPWRDVLSVLPPLYSEDGKGYEAEAKVKFFDPCGSWSWFATEATGYTADGTEVPPTEFPKRTDITDVRFFGLVKGFETELGYFDLRELASVDGPLGIGIERDCWFTPKRLADLDLERD